MLHSKFNQVWRLVAKHIHRVSLQQLLQPCWNLNVAHHSGSEVKLLDGTQQWFPIPKRSKNVAINVWNIKSQHWSYRRLSWPSSQDQTRPPRVSVTFSILISVFSTACWKVLTRTFPIRCTERPTNGTHLRWLGKDTTQRWDWIVYAGSHTDKPSDKSVRQKLHNSLISTLWILCLISIHADIHILFNKSISSWTLMHRQTVSWSFGGHWVERLKNCIAERLGDTHSTTKCTLSLICTPAHG